MKVFLIIAAILLFLLFVPLTIQFSYKGELTVWVGILFPFIRVFPYKKKSISKKKKERPQKEKVSLDRHALWDLIKRIPGHIRRLLTIKKMQLNVRVGNEDPGDLALMYGTANAIVDTAASVLSPIYPREKWQVEIIPDFNSEKTEAEGTALTYTNLWRIIYVLISLLFCGILSITEKGVEKNG